MFSSLSNLPSSTSTGSGSMSSAPTKILDAVQIQSLEEKIPLTSKEEVEKKLASILTQVQQNEVKHLNLTSASLGQFYELAHTLSEHTDFVCCLAVLPNGLIASGSADRTIKLWDLALNSCLSTLQGHTSFVWPLVALPNGLLASGSTDKTIKLWKPKTLSAKQLSAILIALKKNTSAKELDLSGNGDILDDIMDSLIAIFTPDIYSSSKSNTSLKTIDLRGTGVSKQGVRKLKKAIQQQRLSVKVLADCPAEWKMIYFLIIFCRANRNSRFADSGLDLCKHELRPFLRVPSGFFARSNNNPSIGNPSKRVALSPS